MVASAHVLLKSFAGRRHARWQHGEVSGLERSRPGMGTVICFCCNRWQRGGAGGAGPERSEALVRGPEPGASGARPPKGKGWGSLPRSPRLSEEERASAEDEAAIARAIAKGPPPKALPCEVARVLAERGLRFPPLP